ncbi:MAG: excinuclease ABC subunit UvrB [Bacteroidales bacterium]|nr:excinuclease ABC subunit UvrB [Bacteroidales bacterium]
MNKFVLKAPYAASGDQPQAIDALAGGVERGLKEQVLLGVTGSGKTFTMASVIERVQKPTLVIAHNKTLAAQLCSELKAFFPDSAVEYFVSYYDYYQPEAYIASSDTYIEKDSSVNEEIDRLRHSATAALRERKDVIIVASVSCIYSMGDPEEYEGQMVSVRPGMAVSRDGLIRQLIDIQYERNEVEFARGTFRVKGDTVEIIPASSHDRALRIEFFGDEIDRVSEIDAVSGHVLATRAHASIYPATFYATNPDRMAAGIEAIERDLKERIEAFTRDGKPLEAERIAQRTHYDIEMMREIGYCQGIENYSRYFDGRKPGEAPYTLLSYFPGDFLTIIDESHVTVPQIRAMYNGDRARKDTLVQYGFRLPSAYDNRPLLFHEFEERIGQVIYVSATPGPYELARQEQVVEQIIRPTGLLAPEITVRKATGQVDDVVGEIRRVTAEGGRVLVTTLTTKMAEDLTDYFSTHGIRVRYIHHNVETIERMEIIRDLRLGVFDVLVGINLLREGLDIPEVSLVAILDADKEGLLRSETSLIQTIGRAARNVNGRVVMYADTVTRSMKAAIDETNRRRKIQSEYNEAHGITPQSVSKKVREVIEISRRAAEDSPLGKLPGAKKKMTAKEKDKLIATLTSEMKDAASRLDFETAAYLRDKIRALRETK